jgi:hypothetical protein
MIKNSVEMSILPEAESGAWGDGEAKLERESLPLRELFCAFIEQAEQDLRIKTNYKANAINEINRLHRKSAKAFFESPAYFGICNLLNLPAKKIRARAKARARARLAMAGN